MNSVNKSSAEQATPTETTNRRHFTRHIAGIVVASLTVLVLVGALFAVLAIDNKKTLQHETQETRMLTPQQKQAHEVVGISALVAIAWGGEWSDYFDWVKHRYPEWSASYPDPANRADYIMGSFVHDASEGTDWEQFKAKEIIDQISRQGKQWADYQDYMAGT